MRSTGRPPACSGPHGCSGSGAAIALSCWRRPTPRERSRAVPRPFSRAPRRPCAETASLPSWTSIRSRPSGPGRTGCVRCGQLSEQSHCGTWARRQLEEEARMRKVVLLLALASALVFAGTALAVETYGGPTYWFAGLSAGSSWSSGWSRNSFDKNASGYDTTVTFIDNTSYRWHATVRNQEMATYTNWWS